MGPEKETVNEVVVLWEMSKLVIFEILAKYLYPIWMVHGDLLWEVYSKLQGQRNKKHKNQRI